MRASSPPEKLESSLPSRRLSPASEPASACCAIPGSTQGWRACARSLATSAGTNAPWLYDQAFVMAGPPAHLSGSPASAGSQQLGTHSAATGIIREQSSYFPADIALSKKIISSSRTPFIWSTDHVDNNKHAEVPPLLARHLGGDRRRDLHRSRRRGHFSARPLVIHVARDHRRRTTPVAAA